MARGNDSEAARRELDSQYGEHATAEDLIRAHDQRHDPILDAALNKPVDPHATAALDVDALKPQTDGGTIQSAAVRGGVLVVVEEREDGSHLKWYDADHLKGNSAARSARDTAARSVADVVPAPPGADQAQTPGDDLSEPGTVKSDAIQAKLTELGIDKGDATNKDAYWALLPEGARKELKDAA